MKILTNIISKVIKLNQKNGDYEKLLELKEFVLSKRKIIPSETEVVVGESLVVTILFSQEDGEDFVSFRIFNDRIDLFFFPPKIRILSCGKKLLDIDEFISLYKSEITDVRYEDAVAYYEENPFIKLRKTL